MGCNETFTINIGSQNTLSIDLDSQDESCSNECDGSAEVVVINGQEPITYLWSNGLTSNSIDELCSGNYSVTVVDADGCVQTESFTIISPAVIDMDIDVVSPNCFGENNGSIEIVSITGGVAPYYYSINGNAFDADTLFNNLGAGNYTISVQDQNGCIHDQNVTINDPVDLTLAVNPIDTLLQLGESIDIVTTLNPFAIIDSVSWSPSIGLDCSDCLNPTASPLETTLYEVTVYDQNGCSATATSLIRITNQDLIYIPNTFSPNNDGYNDLFTVYGGVGVEMVTELKVFDRWGELVYDAEEPFEPNSYTIGWDGIFRGKEMNPAVFVYYAEVQFIDGTKKIFKGDLTLVR